MCLGWHVRFSKRGDQCLGGCGAGRGLRTSLATATMPMPTQIHSSADGPGARPRGVPAPGSSRAVSTSPCGNSFLCIFLDIAPGICSRIARMLRVCLLAGFRGKGIFSLGRVRVTAHTHAGMALVNDNLYDLQQTRLKRSRRPHIATTQSRCIGLRKTTQPRPGSWVRRPENWNRRLPPRSGGGPGRPGQRHRAQTVPCQPVASSRPPRRGERA